ncbi:MAG TPA: class I SAM-dependent methyltransferase [Thermoleophilaceae bacterium]
MTVAEQHTRAAPPPFLLRSDKRDRAYAPSYDWGSDSLGHRHDRIVDGVWSIPGWSAPEDCRKLYELAYFAEGPILEIGTYCGRSAVVMAMALRDAGRDHPIVSVDIDPAAAALGHRNARAHEVEERIVFVCSTAARFLATVPEFEPALVFVDGDHSAPGVLADLDTIAPHVRPGTLVFFHDYMPDELPNTDGFPVSPHPIEVAEAVESSWVPEHADFAGTFGWSALYRVHTRPV